MDSKNGRLWAKIINDEIEIRSLTNLDLQGALDVLDSFFLNESVCIGCEIDLPENSQAREELRELCRQTAEDGISLVAKDVKTNKVVAVAFNKIQYITDDNEVSFFDKFRKEHIHSPQALCLMDFMISVDAEIDIFEMFKIDCYCELTFLGTLPEWERKGIGRALAKYTIEMTRELSEGVGVENLHPNLRDKHPMAVTALFSSRFSQAVGKSQGFKVLNTVDYSRFSFNGKTFAERIDPMHKVCEHVAIVF